MPRGRRKATETISHPDRAEAEIAAAKSHLDLDLFPEVPAEARPRVLIFDVLRASEIEALRARGYEPRLLRLLPRRTPEEDQAFFLALLQGVTEGTIFLSKSRESGLFYELKARRFLDKKELERVRETAADDASVADLLNWGASRHAFGLGTTMLDPEDIASWARRVQEHALAARQEAAKPQAHRAPSATARAAARSRASREGALAISEAERQDEASEDEGDET
jgi:hypothetical protein